MKSSHLVENLAVVAASREEVCLHPDQTTLLRVCMLLRLQLRSEVGEEVLLAEVDVDSGKLDVRHMDCVDFRRSGSDLEVVVAASRLAAEPSPVGPMLLKDCWTPREVGPGVGVVPWHVYYSLLDEGAAGEYSSCGSVAASPRVEVAQGCKGPVDPLPANSKDTSALDDTPTVFVVFQGPGLEVDSSSAAHQVDPQC